MESIVHPFTDRDAWLKLRRANLNSTDIAALFGLSPYATALELALTKAGKIEEVDRDNERTAWGRRLQDAIASGVQEEYGILATPLTDYIEIPQLRIGASFDFCVVGITRTADQYGTLLDEHFQSGNFPLEALNVFQAYFARLGPGLLEIKNLDPRAFFNDWQIVNGELEAAPHIELQLQHQLLTKGLKWGAIAALIGGNKLKVIIREYDPEVGAAICGRSAQFWGDLAVNKYPPAKLPPDAAILSKLYNFSEPGTFLDGTDDPALAKACEDYNSASARAKTAEDEKDAARAEVLQIMRDNEKGVTAGFKISTWMVEPATLTIQKPGYRSMRITKIKAKETK